MTRAITRFLAASALILITFVAAAPRAEALPNGIYFLTCEGGRMALYNIIGNKLYHWNWACTEGYILKIVIVNRAVSSGPPTITQPAHPAWQGQPAMYWADQLKNETPALPGEPVIDIYSYGDPELFPTLECNESYFDVPEVGG